MLPSATGKDRSNVSEVLASSKPYWLIKTTRPADGAVWFTVRVNNGWHAPYSLGGRSFTDEAEARRVYVAAAFQTEGR